MPEHDTILPDHPMKTGRRFARPSLIAKRPLLFLMLPVAAARLLGCRPAGVWLVAPLTALLLLGLQALPVQPSMLRWLIPLVFCLTLSGQLLRHLPARDAAERLQGQTLLLSGKILDITDPDTFYDQTVFQLDQGGRLWLNGPAHDLVCGTRIQAMIRLDRPDGRRNPGGFDQAAWLRGKGLYLTGEIVGDIPVRRLSPPAGVGLKQLAWQQKQRLIRTLNRFLPERPAALLSAILLGDRSRLTLMDQALLRKAGLSHLTAVSGTHVALLIWPLQSLLRAMFHNRLIRRLILCLVLTGFGALTGWPLSVSRAILMLGLILAASWSGRRADRLNSLSGAALLIMLLQPDAALQTGFWLSVGATLVLIILVPHLAERLTARRPGIPPRLARLAVLPLAIQLSLLPLSLGLSGEVVWAGWLSSWLVMPLIQVLMPYSLAWLLIAVPLSLAEGAAATALLSLSAWPIRLGAGLLMRIAEFSARLPLPRLLLGDFSLPLWLLFITLMLQASGLWHQAADFFGGSQRQQIRLRRCLCLCLCAATVLTACFRLLLMPGTDVWFFDVGQGDAILLRSRRQVILVDGGPPGSGCRVLLPALDALGVQRIHLAIVTHGHVDHCGGIGELMQLGRIGTLLLPEWCLEPEVDLPGIWQAADLPDEEEKTQIQTLLDLARQSAIPVQAVRFSDTINAGSRLSLSVLPLPRSALTAADGNARSLLLNVESEGFHLLLTGDCEETVEKALLEQSLWPDADLLKVAHHGSASSTSCEFLRMVGPEAAVIPVGQYNRYGHPAPQLLDRLNEQGTTVWRTDRHGAIHWQVCGDHWNLAAMAEPPRQDP